MSAALWHVGPTSDEATDGAGRDGDPPAGRLASQHDPLQRSPPGPPRPHDQVVDREMEMGSVRVEMSACFTGNSEELRR